MWTNYKHVCNTVAGQYFKASSDVIIVAIDSNGSALQEGPLNFSFCLLSQKLSW